VTAGKTAWIAIALAGAGCASVSRDAGIADVGAMAKQGLGRQIQFRTGGKEDGQVDARVKALLQEELTPESAVEIALLNNPALQVTFADLGIAQAELVQAGLLRNPTFGASAGFPSGSGSSPSGSGANSNVSFRFSLSQDLLDLLTLPLRKRVAGQQFEQAKLRVGDASLRLAGEAREAYFALAAAEQMGEMLGTIVEAQRASAEFSSKLREAGNVRALDLEMEIDAYETARATFARAQTEAVLARERFARILGVWGEQLKFKLALLPELPPGEAPLEHLETLALERRLDVQSARREVEAISYAASLQGSTRFFPAVQVGVDMEKDPEGNRVIGPSLSLELPIFDQGQARAARVAALVRQSEARLAGQAVNARSEVRSARDRLLAERALVEHYRNEVIPRRVKVMQLSMLQYNAMQVGLNLVLQAKQREIDGYLNYIGAVRDYWIARSQLELAIGVPLQPPGSR
jgi:cobalt-zinc-cadmium efflux system outer membrane protein